MIRDDGLPDDRISCAQCLHADVRRRTCTAFHTALMMDLPRRCVRFFPLQSNPDQRPGAERWPDIVTLIVELREVEREWNRR